MAGELFRQYIGYINKAYLRGDAIEHTHRRTWKGDIGDGKD